MSESVPQLGVDGTILWVCVFSQWLCHLIPFLSRENQYSIGSCNDVLLGKVLINWIMVHGKSIQHGLFDVLPLGIGRLFQGPRDLFAGFLSL